MNAVEPPSSLLFIIILVGLIGLILLVVLVSINSSVFRRLNGRSLETRKKAKNPPAMQGWTEAGRRASTPTPSDIEKQFGISPQEPPKEERQ
ncbi:MAG: hypothetical protein O3B75_10310 [Planctomycetota bacterium]|nr:hypothetical protein [Planctomycetota bacterium]